MIEQLRWEVHWRVYMNSRGRRLEPPLLACTEGVFYDTAAALMAQLHHENMDVWLTPVDAPGFMRDTLAPLLQK